jgi:hypothetical protein
MVLAATRWLASQPVLVAAALAMLVGWFAIAPGTVRVAGGWFILAIVAGHVLFLASLFRLSRRMLAASPPGFLKPIGPHLENFLLLIALNLVILSPLTPIFDGIARSMAAAPHDSMSRYVLGALGKLTGPVLVAVFGAGAVIVVALLVLRMLEPGLRGAGGQRLAGAVDRLVVAAIVAFCAGAIVLSYNSGLDAGTATTRRADLVEITSVPVPFTARSYGWAEVRYLEAPRQVERVLLLPDDDVWPQRVAPGLPVHLVMRPGVLGIPWIQRVAIDRERDVQRVLAAVPTAAMLRKSFISALVAQQRWSEVRAETEAHARAYPEDRLFVAEIAGLLKQHGQSAHAAALTRLAPGP